MEKILELHAGALSIKHVFLMIKTHCCSHAVTWREALFANQNDPPGFARQDSVLLRLPFF